MTKMDQPKKRLHLRTALVVLLTIVCSGLQAQTTTINPFPPTPNPDRIVLNVTQDPSTSIAVNWRTCDTVREGFLEIMPVTADPRIAGKATRKQAKNELFKLGDIAATYHSVVVPGLRSKTLYMYRVGQGAYWSEWFHTRTAGKPGDKLSFIYLGDAQTGLKTLWPRVIRAAYAKMPDAGLILYAGDIVNRGNNDNEWGELFYGGSFIHSTIPGMHSPGNHEYARTGDTLSAFWRPQFTLPENGPEGLKETCYFTDVQGMRFISINSYRVEESDEDLQKQKAWVDSLLRHNPNQWTAVVFHHPFYSIRPTRDNVRMRNTFKPLFDRYKVDIVLQGHDHAYGRGMQKIEGATKDERSGTVYILSVSGPKMSSVYEGNWMDVSASYTQLFQLITVEGNTLRYKSYTAAGELHDAFDLIKQKGKPNKLVEHKPDKKQ
ncbi:metallophosphoesterase family protein [Agriterribacter sp.]|uniref:metallophosphoesterase family protein n=1 Tax=Agriterribacter sp. TaxID=2821509 RepID=UPI002BC5AFE9|nr:metallophosphoesterase family protein [Agriterribacter sp.]HRP57742.1 metallophosphoesterase family protein [Agriterribacter sp.]